MSLQEGRATLSQAVQQALDEVERLLVDPPVDPEDVATQLAAIARATRIAPAGQVAAVKPGREVLVGGRPLALEPDPTQLPEVDGRRIVPEIEWSLTEGGRRVARGTDWTADTVTGPTLPGLFLKPKVVEAPAEPADTRRFEPRVTLTLRLEVPGVAQPVSSGPVTLPLAAGPQPTILPALPVAIPTVLALFRHPRFAAARSGLKGFVLLVFHPHPGGTLAAAIERAAAALPDEAAAALTERFDLPDVVGPLPVGALQGTTALAFLAERIKAVGSNVRFEVAQRIDKLSEIGMPTGTTGLDAGNAVSSLILIGVGPTGTGRTVRCWSGRRNDTDDPYFTLRTRRVGVAVIEDLHSDLPATRPDQSQFDLGKRPGAANTFGDALSAVEFL